MWCKKYTINMQTKQLVFVPQWINDRLLQKGLSADILLDIEKLAPLFSIEDLATMVVLERKCSIFTSINVSADALTWLVTWECSAKSDKCKKLISDIATVAAQEYFADETLQRLFLVEQSAIEKDQSKTFEVSPLGNEGVKVVINKGFPLQSHTANAYQLFRSLVKNLYVYEEYSQLISRPIGKAYVDSLLKQ